MVFMAGGKRLLPFFMKWLETVSFPMKGFLLRFCQLVAMQEWLPKAEKFSTV
uniref:Uncharacterized protein n=1 Tax=Rhizophora mucronata TaxID=61149 RepID=A0A2P2QAH1_RHIMU